MKIYPLIIAITIFSFIACNTPRKGEKEPALESIGKSNLKNDVWEQYMKIEAVSNQMMPPDSNTLVLFNHKTISYYKKNKIEFSGDLNELLINDSLILYNIMLLPDIQIGFNRKDSIMIITKGRPVNGIPTGDQECFAKKVISNQSFKSN